MLTVTAPANPTPDLPVFVEGEAVAEEAVRARWTLIGLSKVNS
jgi:hypothetical protein